MEFHKPTKQNGLNTGIFKFTHSNGKELSVNLRDSNLYTGDVGRETFKSYVLDEDWPEPMPPDPYQSSQNFKDVVEHSMSADMKWRTEDAKQKVQMARYIVLGVIVLVIGIVLFVVVAPEWIFGGTDSTITVVQANSSIDPRLLIP